MTSPNCPVQISPPPPPPPSFAPSAPGLATVSTYSVEPPMAVQASPITTPGGVVSYIRSEMKTGLPTKSLRLSVEMASFVSSADSTNFRAALRKIWYTRCDHMTHHMRIPPVTFSMCFCRFLTPLSLQYHLMRDSMASGHTCSRSSMTPDPSLAWGTRYCLAMASFSSAT